MPEREHKPPVPARAFWSGTITFGLVSIPVDFFAAVRGRRTSMRMVDAKGRPLGRRYYSEEDKGGLDPEEIIRGYKTDEGKMVLVSEEELDAIAPEMSRDIELRRFVPRDQIPPSYYQRPYFLAPAGRSAKAYQLLAHTMQATGRVGIGTFVMRGHQYLVAILSDGRLLRAETLRFAAELRSPQDVRLPKRAKPAAKEVKRFAQAIDSLTRDALDMEELSDRYAEAIHDLASRKASKGKDVIDTLELETEEADEEGGGAEVIDLMKILRQRIGAKPARHDGLEELSKDALYERAQALDIPGRSKMGKADLINAISRRSQ